MRARPAEFLYRPGKREGLLALVHGEGVMRESGRCDQRENAEDQCKDAGFHRFFPGEGSAQKSSCSYIRRDAPRPSHRLGKLEWEPDLVRMVAGNACVLEH